ncbi:hypothetical protein BAUCODRAFT_99957 [Baudoinia panamericana UAMH 10762]|uniref:Sec39 domain-containing protein n=1 Tax=Baudoinia panamericana (strain UAMH 10762) TaxID=717646 RepID=M2N8X8_BAUPA|nr:uncharacterized protein BAUCODRAFT_99957 [Baudoinia panamericana UAMH 10762]EMD00604.1 hypothetical protein BAUCODRAFT_99957 [Baudoinia panamericana UAMH 10762]
MSVKDLSPAQCILLAVHYASSANIKALHSFTPTRLDALDPELVLRILLTYLPESVDPNEYIKYAEEVASRLYLDYDREDIVVDTTPVKELSEQQAQKQVKKLHLLEVRPPKFPPHAPTDLFTRFLCHRACRIDRETGLLDLIPRLVEPFLDRNDFLRMWYVSVVLPMLRLELEYYPNDKDAQGLGLVEFEALEGREGIDYLLVKAEKHDVESTHKDSVLARDVKGLVGPWMYGHTERKRRKLDHDHARVSKISLSGVTEDDKTGHDWEYMYQWLVSHAQSHFSMVTRCVEDWDGPGDVDLGGLGKSRDYLDDEMQRKLEQQYAQAVFASCYAAEADTEETVKGAHSTLARLAELLDFIPPPDLATSVDSLPKIERHTTSLDASQTVADLAPDRLLSPEHPLTTPRLETYMLLQMMVYSAYQLAGLGHAMSLVSVAKLQFYGNAEEQLVVLRKILHGLSRSGARKDETQWASDRAKLMWLWNWGIEQNDEGNATSGAGVLGKIQRKLFEEEMLGCFIETSCYQMATRLYLTNESNKAGQLLPNDTVECVVFAQAMKAYDGASNGNKTRGGMKKANDIITAFKPHFPDSVPFRQAGALITATHSLSFYSLTLQHGVPFQPVSIRVSADPVALLDKILEQNPRSYTKLDDLTSIARNLVSAGLPRKDETSRVDADETLRGVATGNGDLILEKHRKEAERRVTFMAVQAALREDDFETAYSYIVNRLTPSSTEISAMSSRERETSSHKRNKRDTEDDMSWRAAFLAGRYRPSTASPPTLRRLEQRMELLSLALLLAPTSALTDILAAWRRCEEETTSLQLSQQQAMEDFDNRADKRLSGGPSTVPGNFTITGEQPELLLNQKRREMGRMTGQANSEGDAPMSMFDLTRSAARAFSKNAFPLRSVASASSRSSAEQQRGLEDSTGSLGGEGGLSAQTQRVRKRDIVANAVTGGLTSGLGWVLGVNESHKQ